MRVNFLTLNTLNRIIVNNIHKIPHDIDVVVGVPRSGLMVASIIACYLNKPLIDVDGVIADRLIDSGATKNKAGWVNSISAAKNILVVEDSTDSGNSILSVMKRLEFVPVNKIYLSAIVTPQASRLVDIFFAVVPQPRMFEWNYMHHTLLASCCSDLDGVLCEDPSVEQNDDGEKYRDFCLNAVPKLIPSRPIGCIVTARLSKYANETAEWLRKNNVVYGNLLMLNMQSAEERRRLNVHASFKAQIYKATTAILFIESEFKQALEIAKLSGKDVFCVETSEFILGGVCYTSILILIIGRILIGYSYISGGRIESANGRRHK